MTGKRGRTSPWILLCGWGAEAWLCTSAPKSRVFGCGHPDFIDEKKGDEVQKSLVCISPAVNVHVALFSSPKAVQGEFRVTGTCNKASWGKSPQVLIQI